MSSLAAVQPGARGVVVLSVVVGSGTVGVASQLHSGALVWGTRSCPVCQEVVEALPVMRGATRVECSRRALPVRGSQRWRVPSQVGAGPFSAHFLFFCVALGIKLRASYVSHW